MKLSSGLTNAISRLRFTIVVCNLQKYKDNFNTLSHIAVSVHFSRMQESCLRPNHRSLGQAQNTETLLLGMLEFQTPSEYNIWKLGANKGVTNLSTLTTWENCCFEFNNNEGTVHRVKSYEISVFKIKFSVILAVPII